MGARLGQYRIDGLLGHGTMGAVYAAYDLQAKLPVALKILAEKHSRDAATLRRFLREAEAASAIRHPNVVEVYNFGQEGGVHFLAMEFLPGVSAAAMVRDHGKMDWLVATRWAADACRGLEAVHAAGLVHRDMKPGNLARGADGCAKILDFGLVKSLNAGDSMITHKGEAVGTPHYMSPEQCNGGGADARSDIYSLGATYCELLTGRPPYQGDALDVIHQHCHAPPPDPCAADAGIPPACAAVIRRAMAKEPGLRYPAARHMLADLEAIAHGRAVGSGASGGFVSLLLRPWRWFRRLFRG